MYLTLQGKCVKTCPHNSYKLGKKCVLSCESTENGCDICHVKCNTCYSPADNHCLSCKEGFIYIKDSKKCLSVKVTCEKDYITNINELGEVVCSKCHPSCVDCDGVKPNDCTKCLPVEILEEGFCKLCTSKLDFHLKGEDCLENCGKGFRLGNTIACDDNNTISGDGCSANC